MGNYGSPFHNPQSVISTIRKYFTKYRQHRSVIAEKEIGEVFSRNFENLQSTFCNPKSAGWTIRKDSARDRGRGKEIVQVFSINLENLQSAIYI